MRPVLPTADLLLPFLRLIDQNRQFTNFGPLEKLLLQQLLKIQSELDGQYVSGMLACSATQCLELAIHQLNLPAGSKIAIPSLTFVATATAVQRCGHIPVVFDVDKDSWLLTPAQLPEDPARYGIRAVIPVATFGMPQDTTSWANWHQKSDTPVIVDAAASFGGQKTAEGLTVVFSLHATKILSTAEGGLIVSRNSELTDQLRALSNFGIGLYDVQRGTNAKLSEYHAAVGLAHLDVWSSQVEARRQLHDFYIKTLTSKLGGQFSVQLDTGLFAPSVFNIQVDSGLTRERMELACAAQNIQTRRWYQPLVQNQHVLGPIETFGDTPNADELSKTLLGLPFFIDMTKEQVIEVSEVLKCHLS
jgi:dTDP-4-amino-4,6-dideoxygalactose transaminase